jgi:RNA polymerase sigma-70 factor (ECF subfamily)
MIVCSINSILLRSGLMLSSGFRASPARIPYRIPEAPDLPARLRTVLAVVYLIFNEGYSASSGDHLVRADLCDEAIRLGRLLAQLLPEESEVLGLLALMLFIDARRDARTAAGSFVRLTGQDRGLWNRAQIEEARDLLRICLSRNQPAPYQLQAAINAVHCDARSAVRTDWPQIVALYDQLMAIAPSPVVALNRAVAVAELEGADRALRMLDAIELPHYHLFHAVRAELLSRLGRSTDAAAEYQIAIEQCGNVVERDYLTRQYRSLTN